jgi:opacity protein-like surface antigen
MTCRNHPRSHTPRRTAAFVALVLAAAALAAPAAAQPLPGEPVDSRVEITPFAGYRLSGEVDEGLFGFGFFEDPEVQEGETYGVTLDFGFNPNMQIEVWASRQDTELVQGGLLLDEPRPRIDLTMTTVHVGFLYQWRLGQVDPFVVFGGGATRVDPEQPAFEAETELSGSVGGGVKLRFNRHLGLRLEGRVLAVDFGAGFDDDDDDRFRRRDDEAWLVQPEASAGLILSF